MFVKMSLRDRLIYFADFVGMTPLACRTPMAPFLFRLLLANCFLRVCLPTLCSCLENLSTTKNLCNFWRSELQQVSTYRFSTLGEIFTQKWNCSSHSNVQVHRIPVHVFDQYLYRMEPLLVLKQPSCNVFQVRIECCRLF